MNICSVSGRSLSSIPVVTYSSLLTTVWACFPTHSMSPSSFSLLMWLRIRLFIPRIHSHRSDSIRNEVTDSSFWHPHFSRNRLDLLEQMNRAIAMVYPAYPTIMYRYESRYLEYRPDTRGKVKALSLDQLSQIFIIWAVLISGAGILLLIEWLIHLSKFTKIFNKVISWSRTDLLFRVSKRHNICFYSWHMWCSFEQ